MRNPDHRPNALTISEMGALAGTENLNRHTTAYTFLTPKGKRGIGSGTFVQIGSRFFLATVAHTEPKDISTICLVKKSALITPVLLTCVTRRVASTDDKIDVAAFELSVDTAERVGLEPIGIDRIHDGGTGNPNVKARLMGYPETYIVEKAPLKGVVRFHGLGYGCEPIEPSRWQAISTQTGVFDEDVHIVVEFSRDVVSYGSELPVPDGMPDPPGMSGGGIWQRPEATKDDEIWTPSDLCLFGIQSSWLYKLGYLKAIQIIHWLKLIADEYPDLGRELESRFPRLRQI